MTVFTNWKNDPTEPFSPPVYRRGIWHFQAHPAAVAMFATTWLAVFALYLFAATPAVLGAVRFAGIAFGGLMTLYLALYHIEHYSDRRNHRPYLTPYTAGILEHLTVLGFVILVAQLVFVG